MSKAYEKSGLDEVQKASISLIKWNEFYSGGTPVFVNEVQKNMYRTTQQSTIEEQALRSRKLIETIINLILFNSTDEDIYYKDYFYIHEIEDYVFSNKDRNEFYGIYNENTNYHIEWLKKEITDLENKGLDIKKRWYLSDRKSINEIKNIKTSSFRQKYKELAESNGEQIISLLSMSYKQAYMDSKRLHFNPNEVSTDYFENQGLQMGNKVAVLIINAVLKLEELFGEKIIKKVIPEFNYEMVDNKKYYEKIAIQNCKINDYVVVQGLLGVVKEVKKSKYNLFSYKIRYIGKSHLPEIAEDWHAAFEITKLGNKKSLLKRVFTSLQNISDKPIENLKYNSIMETEEFEKILLDTFHQVIKDLNEIKKSNKQLEQI